MIDVNDVAKVSVELKNHVQTYQLDLNISEIYMTENGDGTVLLTPIFTGDNVIDEYKNIDLLEISVIAPNNFVENIYKRHININMSQFDDIQLEAQRRCMLYQAEYNLTKSGVDMNDTNITKVIAQVDTNKSSISITERYWLPISILLIFIVIGITFSRRGQHGL